VDGVTDRKWELLTGSGPGGAAVLPGEGGDDEAQEETHADADQQGLSGMGLSFFFWNIPEDAISAINRYADQSWRSGSACFWASRIRIH
jgi:hypothetical protein